VPGSYQNVKIEQQRFKCSYKWGSDDTGIGYRVGWLVDWCFTAHQHKIGQFVPIYQGVLLAQAFEDSQDS